MFHKPHKRAVEIGVTNVRNAADNAASVSEAQRHTSDRMINDQDKIRTALRLMVTYGERYPGSEGNVIRLDLKSVQMSRDELGALASTITIMAGLPESSFSARYGEGFRNPIVSCSCTIPELAGLCLSYGVELPENLQAAAGSNVQKPHYVPELIPSRNGASTLAK